MDLIDVLGCAQISVMSMGTVPLLLQEYVTSCLVSLRVLQP